MDANGRHVQRLGTGPGSATQPTWSSLDTRLAYVVQRGDSTSIWVMSLRSGRRRRLTPGAMLAYEPTWQPHGGQIAFVAKRRS
jgi:Tol biopolymer transport system component